LLIPNVAVLSDPSITVQAIGNGSYINLSGLETWHGESPIERRSQVMSQGGAIVNVPSLVELSNVDASIWAPLGFNIAQITHWRNSNIHVNQGSITFENLEDADDTNFTITAATVHAPRLTNIGDGIITLFAGGVLDAPNLSVGDLADESLADESRDR
jgi:hypothetical protein